MKRHRQILRVFSFIHKKKQMVGLEIEGIQNTIFLRPGNILQNTGIEIREVELLVGSAIRPEFYEVGEEMFGGKICETDDKFVKDFYIELTLHDET